MSVQLDEPAFRRGDSETTLEVVPRLIELVTSSHSPSVDIRGTNGIRLADPDVSELVGAILVHSSETRVTSLSLKYHHITDEGVSDILRLIEVVPVE